MSITLERILTSPAAFALTTATPVQRAICRVADGLPLLELAAEENVIRAFGGLEAIAALDALQGTLPLELYIVAAIRTGKSLLAAALAVRAAVTCDLRKLGFGEMPRVSVVSITRDLARVVFEHIKGAMLNAPALRPLLVDEPLKTSLLVRHPSGRIVEIMVIAGSRAGSSVAARWSAGVIADEAPKMIGAEDGTINFDDLRTNSLGRLLPGAQFVGLGSPWAPRGPIYDAVRKAHGRPCAHLVVVRAPGPVMNPVWWTPERVATMRAKPDGERAFRTDVLGEFLDAESGWISGAELDLVTRTAPVAAPRDHGLQYVAAMDPATRRNAWTLCIAARVSDEEGRVRVIIARCRQWVPSVGKPLRPGEVFAEMKEELDAYEVSEVFTDRWATDALSDIADASGITVTEEQASAEDAIKRFQDFRRRVLEATVELPPDDEVRADLVAVRMKTTMRNVAFELPVTADGRHCDYAPAIVLVTHIAGSAPTWLDAMKKWRERGGS